jgi:hypothetical protein
LEVNKMTARLEQVESTQAAAAPTQQYEAPAPSNSEVRSATASATEKAQSTIDQTFGSPEFHNGNDASDSSTKNNAERPMLDPDQLMGAAQSGRLGDTLAGQGVDITDDKAVQNYMEKSYDGYIEKGLRLSGVDLPQNPTAEDLGKALIDKVQGAENFRLKEALEANPAEGYKMMRGVYIDAQTNALKGERQRRGH